MLLKESVVLLLAWKIKKHGHLDQLISMTSPNINYLENNTDMWIYNPKTSAVQRESCFVVDLENQMNDVTHSLQCPGISHKR